MSGRKQHFIPQVLLRQFAVNEQRKTKSKRVWVHPVKAAPFLTSTEGVAAQRHFYSELRTDGADTLDDVITRYEGRFSSILKLIMASPIAQQVNSSIASEAVSHLSIRNIHLRYGASKVLDGIISIALGSFSNIAYLKRYMGLDNLQPNKRFDEIFEQKLQDLPKELAALPFGLMRLMAFASARENVGKTANFHLDLLSGIAAQFSSGAFTQQIRAMHNDTLEKVGIEIPHGFITSSRVDDWTVMASIEPVILPDCAVVGLKEDGSYGPLLFTSSENLRYIFLPIGATSILVGKSRLDTWPSLASINEIFAASSEQFFVSSENDDASFKLRTIVGTGTAKLFDDLLQQASKSLQVDPLGSLPVRHSFRLHSGPSEPIAKLGSYSVNFVGFPKEFPEQSLADEVGAVVAELNEVFPLDRLEGLTFARDYEQALRELDRGFDPGVPLSTMPPEYGIGLFQTPLIVRDGHSKFQVISRAELAYGLLSDDEPTQDFYRHGLIRGLGNISFSSLLEKSCPGALSGHFEDIVEGERFNSLNSALMCYFSSRLAAVAFPDIVNDNITLLTETVRVSQEKIAEEIKAHWVSPDFYSVGRSAMYHSSLLLNRFADLAGTFAGISNSVDDFPELTKFLRSSNLSEWFSLFCLDLDKWWSSQDEWSGLDSFLPYVVHFDRMNWALSLPFWKDEVLGWQVFVPEKHEYG